MKMEKFGIKLGAMNSIRNALRNAVDKFGGDVVIEPASLGAHGRRNPSGSKLLRRFFKHKNGRRGSFEEALVWYAGYIPAGTIQPAGD